MARIVQLGAANDDYTGAAHSQLHRIIVGTPLATAVVTVYEGSSTSGTVRATIDAAAAKDLDFGGARFPGGLYIKLTTAAAKVSLVVD